MKKVILAMILASYAFSTNAQTPAFTTTASETLITDRNSDGFDFYTYGVDTTLDDATVRSLQFYLYGTIVVTEISDSANKKVAIDGVLTSMGTTLNIRYRSGTPGKVMVINSRIDSITRTFQNDTGDVSVTKVRKTPRILLVSFTTNEKKDIWVPFSPGSSAVSGDEQFTTSHVVSNSDYTYKLNGKTYRISGTGTLKFIDADNHRTKTKTVHGRRWDQ